MSKTNTMAAACCGTASTALGLAAPHIFCITNAVAVLSGAALTLSTQAAQGLAVIGISAAAGGLVYAFHQGKKTFIMTATSIAAGLTLSAGFNEISGRHRQVIPANAVCNAAQTQEAAEIGVDCRTYLAMCHTGEIIAP